MSAHVKAEPWGPSNPWRPIVTLQDDDRMVEMRLEPLPASRIRSAAPVELPAVVVGYRASTRFSGAITYWARIAGRLTMIKPVSWREIERAQPNRRVAA